MNDEIEISITSNTCTDGSKLYEMSIRENDNCLTLPLLAHDRVAAYAMAKAFSDMIEKNSLTRTKMIEGNHDAE